MNKKQVALIAGGVVTLIGGCVVAVLHKREKDKERRIEKELDSAFGLGDDFGSFSCGGFDSGFDSGFGSGFDSDFDSDFGSSLCCGCKAYKECLRGCACSDWANQPTDNYGTSDFDTYVSDLEDEEEDYDNYSFEEDEDEEDDETWVGDDPFIEDEDEIETWGGDDTLLQDEEAEKFVEE